MKEFEKWWDIEELKPPWADRKLVAKASWKAAMEQVLEWIKEEDAISHLSEVRDKIEKELEVYEK